MVGASFGGVGSVEKTAHCPGISYRRCRYTATLLLYCSSMRSTAAGTHWTPVCTPLTLADTARHVHTSSGTESDIFSAINTLFIRELHQSRNSR